MQEEIIEEVRTVKIYALFDPRCADVVRYIGKTSQPQSYRLSDHISEARGGAKSYKCNWIRKLLLEDVKPCIRVVLEVADDGWQQAEIAQIALHKQAGHPLTNGTLGGDGVVATDEVRRKISEANKGKVRSAACRLAMSERNLGKILSESTRDSISRSNMGREVSQETRDKIGAAQRGRTLSDEALASVREKRKSHIVSDETRKKQSAAKLGKKLTPESIAKREATNKANRASGKKNTTTEEGKEGHRLANQLRRGVKQSLEHIANRMEGMRKAKEAKKALQAQQLSDEALLQAALEEGYPIWL